MDNENKIPNWLLVFNLALLISCLLLFFLIYSALHPTHPVGKDAPKIVKTGVFDDVNLLAKAALVVDLQNNTVVYRKNSTAQLPLASLTKLMTALTALDLLPPDSKITIQREFLESEGDSGLSPNESWNLKNLLDFSLVVSSNDGARSVASVVGATLDKTKDFSLGRIDFIKQMNVEAKKIALPQSYFLNETGLDESVTESGGYGSADDVAKLVQYILKNHPDILESTKYSSISIKSLSGAHIAKNTDILADRIPGLLASKTGYTALAGGNLVVAFDTSIGRPFIAVVLGSTESGRFTDMQKLVDAAMKYATTTAE